MKFIVFNSVCCGVLLLAATLRAETLCLHYDASRVKNRRIPDLSGTNSIALPKGVKVRSIKGRKVFQFDGVGMINVGHSEKTDPSQRPLRVEVAAEIEEFSNGVLVAMGGNMLGYSLAGHNGCPMFAVRANKETVLLQAEKPVSGWVTLAGVITADKRCELLVDGKPVASKPGMFIPKVPNDAMSIGADQGSSVMDPIVCNFAGYIQSVKIFGGGKQ